MAPIAPSTSNNKRPKTARQKAAARLADPLLPRKLHRENNAVTDGFINSKRDKRTIKHSAFVSQISSAISKKSSTTKRRRPSKKLVTTLNSLTSALDDIQDEIAQEDADKPEDGRVRHRSLKSRPGALKRKERVVKGEMERFGKNLAQLAAVAEEAAPTGTEAQKMVVEETQQQQQQPAATSNRWAALRGFISSTMEQNPAFLNKA
ncbi:ribosome biogenesis protein SLX9-domain-containing protein [Cladorrhinum sp. PSN259]|nr:ribosome biogenesis protein SLX9-domain-containing protein [Cladorrhinum sp. PSN259]